MHAAARQQLTSSAAAGALFVVHYVVAWIYQSIININSI
jgi:hypothetical protein